MKVICSSKKINELESLDILKNHRRTKAFLNFYLVEQDFFEDYYTDIWEVLPRIYYFDVRASTLEEIMICFKLTLEIEGYFKTLYIDDFNKWFEDIKLILQDCAKFKDPNIERRIAI